MIDANLNRLGEGLRALEDVARFKLDHKELSARLKALRHQAEAVLKDHKISLLDARNSDADVGAETFDKYPITDLESFVVANARRAEQSCRVLEDIFKLNSQVIDPGIFKQARFAIYTIEKRLVAALIRNDLRQKVKGLYVVLSPDLCQKFSPVETARQALEAGTRLIQLREKHRPTSRVVDLAVELKKLCSEYHALFIVNDSLELALISDADGLHLGQDDLPLETARKFLPSRTLIGISVTNACEARTAQDLGADYVAAGAVFKTSSKTGITRIGLEGLNDIRKAITIPLVAIGGINKDNIEQIVSLGAESAAVISSVLMAASPYESARELAIFFNNS